MVITHYHRKKITHAFFSVWGNKLNQQFLNFLVLRAHVLLTESWEAPLAHVWRLIEPPRSGACTEWLCLEQIIAIYDVLMNPSKGLREPQGFSEYTSSNTGALPTSWGWFQKFNQYKVFSNVFFFHKRLLSRVKVLIANVNNGSVHFFWHVVKSGSQKSCLLF